MSQNGEKEGIQEVKALVRKIKQLSTKSKIALILAVTALISYVLILNTDPKKFSSAWKYGYFETYWNYAPNVMSYHGEFEDVSKFLLENYPPSSENSMFYLSHGVDENISLYLVSQNGSEKERIDLDEKTQKALNTVCDKAYENPKGGIGYILVYDDYVIFRQELKAYSLVYTESAFKDKSDIEKDAKFVPAKLGVFGVHFWHCLGGYPG